MNDVAKVMRKSMIVNILLAITKVIAGIIGKSSALVADGIHSFSDLITDLFAIVGSILSRKPADQEHPFGHGKVEYITSIIISIVILSLGFYIIFNAHNKEIVIPSLLVLIVTILTISIKYILSSYIIRKGKKYNSNILISSGTESRTDVYSSIVVLISTLLMFMSNKVSILVYSDIIASIIVGIFIIKIGYNLLKENIGSILGEVETDAEEISKVKEVILNYKDIKSIDEIYLLKYGTYYKLICEVGMDENEKLKKVHDIIEKIEKELKKKCVRIKYVTIHVNPKKLEKKS